MIHHEDPAMAWPRNRYFGEPWGAPITDEAEQVPTPVGQQCTHCTQPVVEGEQGLVMLHIGLGEDGQPEPSDRPVHRECHLRTVFGPLFGHGLHQELDCPCVDAPDTGPAGWREEGRKVVAWLDRRRGR